MDLLRKSLDVARGDYFTREEQLALAGAIAQFLANGTAIERSLGLAEKRMPTLWETRNSALRGLAVAIQAEHPGEPLSETLKRIRRALRRPKSDPKTEIERQAAELDAVLSMLNGRFPSDRRLREILGEPQDDPHQVRVSRERNAA